MHKLLALKTMQKIEHDKIVEDVNQFVDGHNQVFRISHRDIRELQKQIAQRHSPPPDAVSVSDGDER